MISVTSRSDDVYPVVLHRALARQGEKWLMKLMLGYKDTRNLENTALLVFCLGVLVIGVMYIYDAYRTAEQRNDKTSYM